VPPNVIFLNTDQQSRFALGVGNPWVRTPNLDALSASGVHFTRAYCAAPVCGPSRSCLNTGRPSHETGVLVNGLPQRRELPQISGLFHDAGYDVAWVGNRRGDQPPIPDRADGRFHLPFVEGEPGLGVHKDGPVVDAAIEFLQRRRQIPFLLTVPLMNPHDICYWVMDKAPGVADATSELPPLPPNFEPVQPEPEFIARCRQRTHYGQENTCTSTWDEHRWRRYLREYYALTERVDGQIGRLLSALRDAGLEQDTLILHTADHGEGMAAHRWVVKLMFWENVVGVPLSLSWPGMIPAGTRRAQLATGMDVLPTLCDYAGIAAPPEITGESLRQTIDNDTGGRDYIVIQLHPDTQELGLAARIVVSQQYKYIAFSTGAQREMLFARATDPGEMCDLSTAPGAADVLLRHREHLAEWLAETGDPFGAQ
jgi:arylsulfatase A-like enzyme